jgi:hypothetical protein
MNETKMVRAVRCNSCGLVYPEDYFQEWGRKYGIGLGPAPVCEGLQSDYGTKPKPPNQDFDTVDQVMHPVHVCKGTLSVVDIPSTEAKDNRAILAIGDRSMSKRIAIIREKQAGSPLIKLLKSNFV